MVDLVHDKENKFSKNATKVMLGDKFLGWVKDQPERYNFPTAELVRKNNVTQARICSISIMFDVEEPEKVKAPVVKDETIGIKPEILTHPNIPKPLHGINPRSIKGSTWWNKTRQEVYASNDYHCVACGVHKEDAKSKKWLEAHEYWDIDYSKGICKVVSIEPLCHYCHNFIHSGRLTNIVGKLKSFDECKDILRHGFNILKKNNLQCFPVTYDLAISLGVDTLGVEPYPIGIGNISLKWEDWKLIFEGKEYHSKFKDISEWENFYLKK